MTNKIWIYKTIGSLTAFILITQLDMPTWAISTQPEGDTVIVNETNDLSDMNPGDGFCDTSGDPTEQCSLRAAIEELNAQGPDTTPHQIEFNIPGTGPFTISPASALPAITVPVEIRGETQPGTTCPTDNTPANLLIVLDGSNAGADTDGLSLNAGSDGSLIRGLVIGNFTADGIRISSSNDNRVRCNHIGLGADGVSEMGNDFTGVYVGASGNSIGGALSHAQRNVISGNGVNAIRLEFAGENNLVVNNFIGTTADGMSALGNDDGIYTNGNNNTIGGDDTMARNVVSGNNGYGIRVNNGDLNLIQGNYIGVAHDGITPLPNFGHGIELLGDAVNNLVGISLVHGPSFGAPNLIINNEGYGVLVDSNAGGTPVQNLIRGNAMFNNSDLGIDLGGDGVDSNDPGDGDTGENEHQNYPVLFLPPGSTVLTGTLDSQANTGYVLDLYRSNGCDPSGYGEGQEHLLTEIVTTDGSGHAEIAGDLAGLVSPGDGLTATATDSNGNTSEFSACVTVSLPTTPIPTDTPTPTNTPTPTTPPTPGPSSTPTATPTASLTPTSGPSPTPTATATIGPSPTATATATSGPSPTTTSTPISSPTPMCTPSPDAPPCTPTPPPILDYWVYLPITLK